MTSTAAMVSPSFPFPGPQSLQGPFGHGSAANAHISARPSGISSPPESRRTSGDEAPSLASSRQSLPSISEALSSADCGLPPPTQIAPPPPPTSSSYFPANASTSVSEVHRRSMTTGAPSGESHLPYPPHHPQSPFMNRAPHAVPTPHTPTTQSDLYARQSAFAPQPPKLPTLQPIKTDTSPSTSFRPTVGYSSSHPSPAYDTPPQSAPAQPPYGYPGYQPPSYQHPPAPAPPSAGPLYPSSGALAPPRHSAAVDSWGNGRYPNGGSLNGNTRSSLPMDPYGESVKRHLEDFDLEASLNEIADCAGKMLEFTKTYGIRAHSNQRNGPDSSSFPAVMLLDELLQKNKRMEESLNRIRDMVLAKNANEQRLKDIGADVPGGYGDMNGYNDDRQGMGGFAGGDAKKRRGRAAPPGRCHSCNRAETPEWRRGPDGARTLCNACGLHYAKLTRKVQLSKGQLGGTNLRPKVDA